MRDLISSSDNPLRNSHFLLPLTQFLPVDFLWHLFILRHVYLHPACPLEFDFIADSKKSPLPFVQLIFYLLFFISIYCLFIAQIKANLMVINEVRLRKSFIEADVSLKVFHSISTDKSSSYFFH